MFGIGSDSISPLFALHLVPTLKSAVENVQRNIEKKERSDDERGSEHPGLSLDHTASPSISGVGLCLGGNRRELYVILKS